MSVLTQSAQLGVTHVKTIKFSDFTETVSATEEVIDCFTIPANSIVEKCGYVLKTNFDGASSSDLTLELGDDDDDDGFMTVSIIHEDATEVNAAYNTGAYFVGEAGATDPANATNGKLYLAAKTVKAAFIPTGDSLDDITSGEVVIFATIVELDKLS